VAGVETQSGVAAQPIGEAETILGAQNRANSARLALDADLGVGLEGGVYENSYGMFVGAWAVVVDRQGRVGIGAGGRVLLPERIAQQVRLGRELGPVMDEVAQTIGIRSKEGAIGILTAGRIDRTMALSTALEYALSHFLAPTYYEQIP
jgi:inosine/xanthosine triphosphatase